MGAEYLSQMNETAKHLTDGASVLVAIGTIAQILPHIAALFTIIWLAIRIWESDTARGLTGRPLTGRRDED